MEILKIRLNRTNEIVDEEGNVVFSGSVLNTAAYWLDNAGQNITSVTWRVAESAPVSVERQNASMLRRAKKLAKLTGCKIEAFDFIFGSQYGCAMVRNY